MICPFNLAVFGTDKITSFPSVVADINELAKSGHRIHILGNGKKLHTRGIVSDNPVAAIVPLNPMIESSVDSSKKLNVVVVCVITNTFELTPIEILNWFGSNALNVVIKV
jgi:hypothetical protein